MIIQKDKQFNKVRKILSKDSLLWLKNVFKIMIKKITI